METTKTNTDQSTTQINKEAAELEAIVAQGAQTAMTGVSPELEEKLKSCVVNMAEKYPENQFAFSVDNVPVITIGDIHTIGAKQKGGKTSLVSILISTVMSGKWNRVECNIKGASVLYVDTEMKKVDTQMLGIKATAMADVETMSNDIHLVNFRPLTPSEMEIGIRYFIEFYKPKLVIIDGIVDLCANFNDVEASQRLVLDFLMKTAEENQCAIINVLHTNKTDGYTELRGHLGAFFEQKGATVIKCEKDDGSNIVTVKVTTHRYRPVPEFHFSFDEQGTPICADSLYEQLEAEKKRTAEEQKEADRRAIFKERSEVIMNILKLHGGTMERKSLITEAMELLKKGKSTINNIILKMKSEPNALISEENSVISLR